MIKDGGNRNFSNKMDKNQIAVLIPAHNEAKAIGGLVSEVRRIIPNVFVIDDGSTDNTAEIARANGAFVIRHQQCMGKGAALKTGFSHLKNLPFLAYITMDGDGQHLPSDIGRFINALERNKKAGTRGMHPVFQMFPGLSHEVTALFTLPTGIGRKNRRVG